MSLINDALKRATQAQPSNTPPTEPGAPMQPVEQRRPVGLPIYFTPTLLFIVCGACWFLVKGWEAHRQAGLYPEPVSVQARETVDTPAPAAPESAVPANRHFALDAAPTPASSSQPAAKEAPAGALAQTGVAAATVPDDDQTKSTALKLQGIFYRPRNPSAVINSKTVFVGDPIANGRVKAIDRQSVTVDLGGETKVLTFQ